MKGRNETNSDGMSMELEELNPGALIGPQQDVESIERWAERNGISYGTARAWVYRVCCRLDARKAAHGE